MFRQVGERGGLVGEDGRFDDWHPCGSDDQTTPLAARVLQQDRQGLLE